MKKSQESRKAQANLRLPLALIALGAGVLALEWRQAHTRALQHDRAPKSAAYVQQSSAAAKSPQN